MNESEFGFETQAIRTQLERSQFKEHSVPLYLTSSFVFEDAEDMRASFSEEKDRNIYSRFSNPNTTEFVEKICKMEGAEAGYAFATGMAAVYSTFAALLNSGDHIVSASSVFGSTHALFTKYFPKWNIQTSYFDINKPETIESYITENTKILYAESPTNPAVDILDLEYLGQIAKKHNLILIIDNCFATPYIQNPIQFGAHLVIHSATKLIDGQGRVLGGVTVGREDLIREIYLFSRNTGPALSPFNAWVLVKSLETMDMRVRRMSDNAQAIAEYLEKRPEIKTVRYPGLPSHPEYALAQRQMSGGGSTIGIEFAGSAKDAFKVMNALRIIDISNNLGDSKSLITHPASTTHRRLSPEVQLEMGITPSVVRLSVGLEYVDDLIKDLDQAFKS